MFASILQVSIPRSTDSSDGDRDLSIGAELRWQDRISACTQRRKATNCAAKPGFTRARKRRYRAGSTAPSARAAARGAALDYTAVLENDDDVGVLDRGEPVSNNEHRPALHERVHTALDDGLRARVDGARGLVEYHDRRVRHRGSRYRDELALALREVRAVRRSGCV